MVVKHEGTTSDSVTTTDNLAETIQVDNET